MIPEHVTSLASAKPLPLGFVAKNMIARSQAPRREPLPFLRSKKTLRTRFRAWWYALTQRLGLAATL